MDAAQKAETVYKYSDEWFLAILENLELKVTPPNQFNDIYEFTPRIVCSNPRAYVEQLIQNENHVQSTFNDAVSIGRFTGTLEEFKRMMASPRHVDYIMSGIDRVIPSVQRESVNRISEAHAVLCLSKRRDSLLMWSHYAYSHTGAVVGFDSSADIFRKNNGLRDVNYVTERVVFDANWQPDSPEMLRYNDEIILSKNTEWTYEAELRQIFKLSELRQKPLKNGLGYFLPFPADAVVEVIFGTRCPKETIDKVKKLFETGKFPRARLLRGELHKTTFAVEIVPV